MQQERKTPPPDAGEAGLFEFCENRSGGGDQKCRASSMKERGRKLRNEATEAEKALWIRLRGRQLLGYKFRRQQVLGRYIVDFVCLEKRLVVEVDGSQHFVQQRYDEARTRWLEAQGYRVIRFLNNEVLGGDIEAVIDAIVHQLED